MARRRGAKLKEDRLSDKSIVFSADVTVAVGDRRHITLGYSREGMDRTAALKRLAQEEAKVALGQWEDPRPPEPTGAEVTFEVYASDWYAAKERELSENARKDLKWRLTKHLIPFFGPYLLGDIDKKLVKAFREFKLQERDQPAGERPVDKRGQPLKPLSNTSINMVLQALSAIFNEAVEEDELLEANPVGKKRLKKDPPKRTWLMPDELLDLIEAAERVDQRHKPETLERAREVQAALAHGATITQAAVSIGRALSTTQRLAAINLEHREPSPRRAIITTLGLAGPRVSELCALESPDVDLANRRLAVDGRKTDAAERKIKIVDFLRGELIRYKLEVASDPDGPLYPTATGGRRTKDNIRQRVLPAVVREANRVRRKRGEPPIREDITPHTLRRTFISMQLAYGRDVPFVQRQAGHKDPRTTLRIYTEVIDTDFGPTAEILELLTAYSGAGEGSAQRRRASAIERNSVGPTIPARAAQRSPSARQAASHPAVALGSSSARPTRTGAP